MTVGFNIFFYANQVLTPRKSHNDVTMSRSRLPLKRFAVDTISLAMIVVRARIDARAGAALVQLSPCRLMIT